VRDLRCLHSLPQGCTNSERQVAVATKLYTEIAKRWPAVAQLVEALRYKPEGPEFIFR
jgi:hypothetical protein